MTVDKNNSKHIIADAEYHAEQLVSSSEIKKRSERIADETMQRATKKCDQLFAVTKENVDKLLKSVELYLDQNLDVVKRNRDELDNAINNSRNNRSEFVWFLLAIIFSFCSNKFICGFDQIIIVNMVDIIIYISED